MNRMRQLVLQKKRDAEPQITRRRAFTLVEVLVALGIMMLLMVIILVPVNMALNVFHIGRARSDVQQANRLTMNQIVTDLRQTTFVYPNEQMPGITSKSPYTSNSNYPYYQLGGTGGVRNLSRLDMILPVRDSTGNVVTPLQPTNYIVTYYARRFKPTTTGGADNPYDNYTNPVVLWRAQYPYKNDNNTTFASYSATNTNNTSSRYPITPSSSPPYAGQIWLTQSAQEEPNLETLCTYSSSTTQSSHVQVTPRDMGLVAPNAESTTALSYKPDTTFSCDDINNDGKIDRVTISINQAKYDALGAQSSYQRQRLVQIVDLPNVK